jgi:hypothetical protein
MSLITLTDFDHLIAKAAEIGYISEDDVQVLKAFRKSLNGAE